MTAQPRPQTIQQLLLQAVESPAYGLNSKPRKVTKTQVYSLPELPDADFSNFLLRVEDPKTFKDKLRATTALVPVHLCAAPLGQKLLESSLGDSGSAGIQIIYKMQGRNLYNIKNEANPDAPCQEIHLLQVLNELPVSAYEKLLMQMENACKDGVMLDISRANILCDQEAKTLCIVDPVDHFDNSCDPAIDHIEAPEKAFSHENNIGVLKRVLCGEMGGDNETNRLRQAISDKINQAVRNTAVNLDIGAVAERVRQGEIKLTKLHKIRSITPINLQASPFALREKLREIDDYNQSKRR